MSVRVWECESVRVCASVCERERARGREGYGHVEGKGAEAERGKRRERKLKGRKRGIETERKSSERESLSEVAEQHFTSFTTYDPSFSSFPPCAYLTKTC